MLSKPLDAITSGDIDSLVADQVAEGKTIDYKRDLPGNSDSDKKEFLADVTSFANTAGGDIVFGIDEAEGQPTTIVGLTVLDVDAEIRRLDSIIETGVAPRIRYSLRRLTHGTGVELLLLRIEQSWNAPHRVVLKGHDRFYARNSAGKYSLDVGELRDAFMRSSALADRVRLFHDERIVEISAGRTPVPLRAGAKLVLHLIPLSAFGLTEPIDISGRYGQPHLMQPMSSTGWNHRITLEGMLTYSLVGGESQSYTHLYRNGIVEAVDAYILTREYGGRRLIPSATYEERILEFTAKYLDILKAIGVSVPIYICIALLGAKGCWMGTASEFQDLADRYPIDRDVLDLPPIALLDYEADMTAILRPVLDMVWNACGYPKSQNFGANGKWAPPRGG